MKFDEDVINHRQDLLSRRQHPLLGALDINFQEINRTGDQISQR